MNWTVFGCVALAASLVAVDVASAQSLRIRQLQRDETARFTEEAARIENACGVAIPATIDWSSFEDGDYQDGASVAGFCWSSAVDAIAWLCDDDLARDAITQRINRLECAIGEERTATITEDGTYRYTFTWNDANSFTWHQDFLRDNL